jgi:hypothetical protein
MSDDPLGFDVTVLVEAGSLGKIPTAVTLLEVAVVLVEVERGERAW